jgi:nicotinate-nucleotide adenylyltransferase
MKVAVFSGSFDPPHKGHLAVANYLLQKEHFDEVWFTVTPHNPLKEKQALSSTAARIAMIETVIARQPGFRVCDIECTLPQPSYTINTLTALCKRYPQHTFTLVVGADNWTNFRLWKDYDKLAREFHIMIYPRKGNKVVIPREYPNVQRIAAPTINISSTTIRQAAARGDLRRYAHFLHPGIPDYIIKENLY